MLRHLKLMVDGEVKNPFTALKIEIKNRDLRKQALMKGMNVSLFRQMVGKKTSVLVTDSLTIQKRKHRHQFINEVSSDEEELARKIMISEQ